MEISALHPVLNAADLPLERLAGNSNLSEPEKIAEVCRQFEAALLRQILQQARKTVIDSEFNSETATSGIYQDMVNEQLAESISRSGALGLATSLQAQLTHQLSSAPETNANPTTAMPAAGVRVKERHE
jgi:Rod binding domain-containing protein